MLEKQQTHAFGKDVYLLGEDLQGIKYWLEAPSWDCDWYWGFGFIETYTNNNNPSNSRDITSHQHANKFMSEFFTEINGSKPILNTTTFTEKEGWKLSELFKQFYLFQEMAELQGRGGTHISYIETTKGYTSKEEAKRINEEIIPKITKQILDILTPSK